MHIPLEEDEIREHRRRGRAWSVEEIHEAVKRHRPKFVLLPAEMPGAIMSALFVTDPEILTWVSFPTVVRRGSLTNAFYLADALYAARTVAQWQHILGGLEHTEEAGDRATAEAIATYLGELEERDPHLRLGVRLDTPTDWLDRVEQSEARLRKKTERSAC